MQLGTTPLSYSRPTFPPTRFRQRDDRSGLERAAGSTVRVRQGRPALLASLLLAGLPRREADDTEVLWPVWATEALFRAGGLLTLVASLERLRRRGTAGLGRRMDADLARSVGAHYQAVQSGPTRAQLPCSPILRDMAATLVSLFGEVAGGLLLRTDIARLALPGFQRRALVLAASTLVIDVLIEGAKTLEIDVVELTLRQDRHVARLCVTVRDRAWSPGPALVAASALADLLEGEFSLRGEGQQAEIVFPVPATVSV